MIPYILHVTVIIAVCFLFYKVLLQKETFFRLNRWTLLACLAVSFALPFLPVPKQWSLLPFAQPPAEYAIQDPGQFSGRPAVQPADRSVAQPASKPLATPAAQSSTSPVTQSSPQSQAQSSVQQPVQAPVQSAASTGIQESSAQSSFQTLLPRILQWLYYLYLFGVALFALNLIFQAALLLYQSRRNPSFRDGRFRIVEMSGDKAPCSFGNIIFINPSKYDWDTYNQILLHEKIHIRQGHTLDILIAEVVLVLQWFNPFAWFY